MRRTVDVIQFYAANWAALREWQRSATPFSVWLHFDRDWDPQDAQTIANLIKYGCRYLMINGAFSESIHEMIDDVSIAETNELVLTSSSVGSHEEVAFEFISTRCPSGPSVFSLISATSSSALLEIGHISEMAEALGVVLENN